jgi:hypothetical protein
MRPVKIILAATVATVALGAIVSTTSATRIARTSQTFRATWPEVVFEGGATFGVIKCPLTIEGTFHSRTASKVAESLSGFITSSTIGTCTGGSARMLTEQLPWHVRYESFEGTLPSITGIRIRVVGSHFLAHVNLTGQNCLYASTAASPIKDTIIRNTSTGVAEAIRINESASIPLLSGAGGFAQCPLTASLKGSSRRPTVQGTTTAITVTLVP